MCLVYLTLKSWWPQWKVLGIISSQLISKSSHMDLWVDLERDFCFFPLFPMCSHQVPMGFPKTFPIAPQFYPVLFAKSSRKGRLKGSTFVSILQLGSKELLLLKSAQCSKKVCDGPINVAPSREKKRKSVSDP
jgi:hypothetical protein